MRGNSVGGENSILVEILEEEDGAGLAHKGEEDGAGLAHKMKERMRKIVPVVPSEPAAGENHCIFKLPESFKNINEKYSYEAPQMVSIGPYHRGNIQLQKMQKFKWQCLDYFLKRTEGDLKGYIDSIRRREIDARGCYSETINLSIDKFLQMMVLDSCFILEWLRFTYSVGKSKKDVVEGHPLSRMDRVTLLKIYRDLLLLENQVPLFVLEELISMNSTDPPLYSMGAEVFSAILGFRCSRDNLSRFNKLKCWHLLDIVRSIFIPPGREALSCVREDYPLEFRYRPFDSMPCISKLRRAGINVKPHKKDMNFLVVEFRCGVIEMPNIILNDLMCSFLVNCVAFEQCHISSSNHFSIYALFLDYLVNTAGDVEYLCDGRVIENYIETDAASFINNLGKALTTFECDFVDFFKLCRHVNEYYQNTFHRQCTSFKREYFGKPWLWISALVLLVLAILQTYYTIHPKH